ncbi:MAG TPA: PASTA domain-containing protein [Gaiellaceae bacterium]|nr:PASTA domain-containing protein [Gaiellaceae bacterium]
MLATALAGALAVGGGLVDSPAAQAAIKGSQITTPSDPSFLIADGDAATQTFAVSGTTSGGNPATDRVDLRCYYDGKSALVAKSVALGSGGSFSVPAASLGKLLDHTCRLRAVPAGSSPSNLAPYAGPLVGVGERDSSAVGGGPNNGKLTDYYLYAAQQTAAFDYVSLGGCGIKGGYLLDPKFAVTTTTFFCNAGLFRGEAATASTRSELRIDHANAYTPEAAGSINPNAAGLPALSYSYKVDAHTGNVAIRETDPLVECADTSYPPTAGSCATFVSAGVTDARTITQDHDGHISWISDVFTSTDGKAHALDLLWDNTQHFHGSKGDSSRLEYSFPGHSGYSTHLAGDAVALPGAAPGTILIRVHGAADGDTSTGQGALVYDRPVARAAVTSVSADASELTLQQTGAVPAGASTRFRFAYVQDYHAARVAALAQTAAAAFRNTISVSKAGKGKGKVTSSPGGISCGEDCRHGYAYGTSVMLKAKAAKGSRFAGWSGACKGRHGCKLTANADAAVKAKFVLRPCVVPSLVGKTLPAAKLAIRKAFCSVGEVTRVASSATSGRVVSQKPRHGKRVAQHTKIRLVLSEG